MKNKIIYVITGLFSLLFFFGVKAQNNIGINTTSPDASAALDVTYTTGSPKGMLIPRMTQAQRTPGIASPAAGLLVYQTDGVTGFYYYNGAAWILLRDAANTYPNVELFTSVTTSQTVTDLENASPPTFSVLNFSSSNNANASLTGGNTWNGNTFTVGAGGAGWYKVEVQMVAAGTAGSNTNAANNILVHMFMDKNNSFGTNPGNNTAPAYIQSTTNNTTYPYTWSNFITAGSSNVWLKGLAQISTTIYLAVGDFINFKACSESNSAAARTTSDGSSNITITRLK